MRILPALLLSTAVLAVAPVNAQQADPPFGGPADVEFAERLWNELALARLVGPDAIESHPYEGFEPHGAILTTLQTTLRMDAREGDILVKNNYIGENVSIQSVADNPRLNLDAVTIMFRREAGYDPQARNWFWAKYNGDGTLSQNPAGVRLAGRIARNPDDGCIACHQFAPGNDYVFLNDRFTVPDTFTLAADDHGGAVFRPARLDVQPNAADLTAGLAVDYYFNIFNFVDEVREWAELQPGQSGQPLQSLDYNVGSGSVLTSDRPDGVGAIIGGLINFSTSGTYTMAARSNDGIELTIGGETILSDPTVHADRFSNLVTVEIAEPGWYPLDLVYFEKRNTSTLELYWATPDGDGALNFVPPTVFAHRSG